jgi:glycosyltransferase involved in cell wall biosynthesis
MKILMLLENPIYNDRRARNEIFSLRDNGFNLTLIHKIEKDKPVEDSFEGVPLFRILNGLELHDPKNFTARKQIVNKIIAEFDFDVLYCHNQLNYHIGKEIKKLKPNTILIYESRELFHAWPLNVSSYSSKWLMIKSYLVRKYEIIRERKNAALTDYVITVCQSLADNLNDYLNLKNKAVVLRNIPAKSASVTQSNNYFRTHFNLPESTKILIFIGGSVYLKTLNLEQVIDEFGNQPNTAFIMMASDNDGKKGIFNYVLQKGYSNIFYHPYVPLQKVPETLASADVGLVPTWNKNDLSYWYALDNKLFDYIISGIPILATQQPEYKNIVEPYQVGICVNPDEKNAYINGFNSILKTNNWAENLQKAKNDLNWENEQKKLIELFSSIKKQYFNTN